MMSAVLQQQQPGKSLLLLVVVGVLGFRGLELRRTAGAGSFLFVCGSLPLNWLF
jgi:hypothetical protein